METRKKWQRALTTARRQGVSIRQNVRKCCRSCITESDLGLSDASQQPYAFTFGGQGFAYRWVDDRPVYPAGRRRLQQIHFNHGNGAGRVLADALKAEGFTVDWDGTDTKCVTVVFDTVPHAGVGCL